MSILITGAGGFVGSRLLTKAVQIYGHDNVIALSSKEISGCRCVVIKDQDLTGLDNQVFSEVKVLIHAGAFTPKNSKEANCLESCNRNIAFTQQLLEFPFNSLKKAIYTSTLDVYGDSSVISEITETRPATLYGASKLYCEKMFSVFGSQNGISTQILRLGHIYGPGEEKYQKMLPLTIRNILLGNPVEIWGDGSELRSFIYIDDVVSSVLKSLESASSDETVNVVGGKSLSIRNLVERLIAISGKKVEINFRAVEARGKDYIFDNSLLKRTLLAHETDFEIGLKTEYDYMKNKLNA